jgi:hypothetical protein
MASLLFKLASGARRAVGADKLVDSLDGDALRLVYPLDYGPEIVN